MYPVEVEGLRPAATNYKIDVFPDLVFPMKLGNKEDDFFKYPPSSGIVPCVGTALLS